MRHAGKLRMESGSYMKRRRGRVSFTKVAIGVKSWGLAGGVHTPTVCAHRGKPFPNGKLPYAKLLHGAALKRVESANSPTVVFPSRGAGAAGELIPSKRVL